MLMLETVRVMEGITSISSNSLATSVILHHRCLATDWKQTIFTTNMFTTLGALLYTCIN